jgi:opacity protein-like surface antigen
MKKMLFMLAVISFCGSFALALSPMGPPSAGLQRKQFMAGADYSYSKMDIKLNHGRSPGGGPRVTMNDLKRHYVLANLGYGLRDNWEASFRIGGGAARDEESGGIRYRTASPTFGNGYVFGFGTKATFIEDFNIRWGGLFQILWAKADGRAVVSSGSWSADTKYMEIQVAAGPTYQLNERASIYGGPFFHILDGRFVAKSRGGTPRRICYDLDEGSVFGGYVGTEINVIDNAVFRIEYQHTAAADALGMSLLFRF